MKKLSLASLLFFLGVSISVKAQFLSPGDISFISYKTDDPDRFAFVLLKDIPESDSITFTDDSWDGSAFLGSEGTAVWKAPNGGLTKGTVVQIEGTNAIVESSEKGEVTEDDFESGNLSTWALYAEPGNTITIDSDTVHNGSYSARIEYGGTNHFVKMARSVNNLTSVYFRAYLWISKDFRCEPGHTFLELVTFDSEERLVAKCDIRGDAIGRPKWWAIVYRDTSGTGSSTTRERKDRLGIAGIVGAWTLVEFTWEKGTANDGWLELKVNGERILSDTSRFTLEVDSIKIGSTRTPKNHTGHIYWDDVVVDTSGWIGEYGPGGIIASNNMNLDDVNGDQIFTYQGSSSSPSFIAGISSNQFLQSGIADPNYSYLPSPLIKGTNALDFVTESDNGYYNIAINENKKEDLLNSIDNVSNWSRSDDTQTWPSWSFIVTEPLPIIANLKVYLEGPYNGSSAMTTTLNTNNFIPLNSNTAYSTTTYGYTASVVGSIPNSTIVDWVLVELRTTATGTKVGTRAAFLKSDGTIVDIDGISPVKFTALSAGNYYVVVRHRNHLAIMTASAIPLSGSSVLYDCTTTQSQAYTVSTDPMVSLSGGGFGMIGADGNKDGGIYAEDYILYRTSQGNEDYLSEDYNLDGGVYAEDYILYRLNQGYETNVP